MAAGLHKDPKSAGDLPSPGCSSDSHGTTAAHAVLMLLSVWSSLPPNAPASAMPPMIAVLQHVNLTCGRVT